ncbi:MAG: peptidase M14 [Cytophagales bacterium]|nr:MAG: peptidase M14 [Cytophagales bacterium]TAF61627.1 MAG: peptidase M14 [Cytophagales bacterium]
MTFSIQDLLQNYECYEEPALLHRFFKFRDLFTLIEFHNSPSSPFKLQKLGSSVKGKSIYSFTYGNGPTKVLLWSQMHGDEPTATMALFDLFNLLSDRDQQHSELRQLLQSQLTLVFVPMLNPDGAEMFTRRNALGIDLNRDYLSLSAPESTILHDLAHEFKPHFAFNLHDQSRYYAVGDTDQPVNLAFLAPSANPERTYTPARKRAVQLIAQLYDALKPIIGAQMAKYADDYAPRCFGDSFQKAGYSTILIESGYVPYDEEKQIVRKYTFVAILKALVTIAQGLNDDKKLIKIYEEIPLNKKEQFFDYIISGVLIEMGGKKYITDLGVNVIDQLTANSSSRPQRSYWLADVGDLRAFHAFKHIRTRGLRLQSKNPIQFGQKADFKLYDNKKIILEFAHGILKRKVADIL